MKTCGVRNIHLLGLAQVVSVDFQEVRALRCPLAACCTLSWQLPGGILSFMSFKRQVQVQCRKVTSKSRKWREYQMVSFWEENGEKGL